MSPTGFQGDPTFTTESRQRINALWQGIRFRQIFLPSAPPAVRGRSNESDTRHRGYRKFAYSALVSRPEDGAASPITCPRCGDNYLHIICSGVHQKDVLHLVCSDVVRIVRGMPVIGRGSAVITIYGGECGHSFAEVTRFHKGECFRGRALLPDGNGIMDWPSCL